MRVGRGYLCASPLLPTLWCEAQACSVAGAYPSYLSNSAYTTRRPLAAGAEPESHLCRRGRQQTLSRSAPAGLHSCEYPGRPRGRRPLPCPGLPHALSHARPRCGLPRGETRGESSHPPWGQESCSADFGEMAGCHPVASATEGGLTFAIRRRFGVRGMRSAVSGVGMETGIKCLSCCSLCGWHPCSCGLWGRISRAWGSACVIQPVGVCSKQH